MSSKRKLANFISNFVEASASDYDISDVKKYLYNNLDSYKTKFTREMIDLLEDLYYRIKNSDKELL